MVKMIELRQRIVAFWIRTGSDIWGLIDIAVKMR